MVATTSQLANRIRGVAPRGLEDGLSVVLAVLSKSNSLEEEVLAPTVPELVAELSRLAMAVLVCMDGKCDMGG